LVSFDTGRFLQTLHLSFDAPTVGAVKAQSTVPSAKLAAAELIGLFATLHADVLDMVLFAYIVSAVLLWSTSSGFVPQGSQEACRKAKDVMNSRLDFKNPRLG